MIEIIEAPNHSKEDRKIKLFLAGGITNCPDWQKEVIDRFQNAIYKGSPNGHIRFMLDDVTVYNPRRENFPIDDPSASEIQIKWEYEKLRECNIIAFWFSSGSLNPIVLYEYGKHGISQPTTLIVGCDKEYPRIKDVEIQTKLAKPSQKIFYILDEFYEEIIDTIYNMIISINNKEQGNYGI